MKPAQRKNFYAQKFHARLGPFTSGSGHVRVPKDLMAPKTPAPRGLHRGAAHAAPPHHPQFEPEFQAVPRKPTSWEDEDDEPLSAATFRARALERALRGDEPQNSAPPQQRLYTTPAPKVLPRAPSVAPPTAAARAAAAKIRPPARVQQAQAQRVAAPLPTAVRASQQPVYAQPMPSPAPAAPSRPVPVVNGELSSLDVMVGNSALTVQPKHNLYPRAAYLLSDAETPDLYSKDTVAFSAPTAVCCVELVLEVSGPLGRFDQYDGSGAVSVSFYAGAHAVLAPCKCLADYLMHGRLESYEFGADQLHLFRLPLGFAEGQGIVLRDRAKLRVVLEGELAQLRANGERHRFFVRYHEEK